MEVAYRERPATATRIVHTLDRMLSGKHQVCCRGFWKPKVFSFVSLSFVTPRDVQNVTLTLDIEPALGCGQPVFAYDAEAISEHSG